MRCDYILGLAINSTLLEIAEPWREQCDDAPIGSRPQGAPLPSIPVRGPEWGRAEKVIARVEATELGTDARFIVTNLTGAARISTRRSTARAGAWRT